MFDTAGMSEARIRDFTNAKRVLPLSADGITRIKDYLPIDLLFLRRARESFTYIEMSPLPVKPEGQQNLGLCSVLRAIEEGEILIVQHLL
jgi:hypothetical protein